MKKKIKTIVSICISVVILALIIINSVFYSNYSKNKKFTNGIEGEYYCTRTLPTAIARNLGFTQSVVDDYFLGKSVKINEYGTLSGLTVSDESIVCPLECKEKYSSLDKSYILYKPSNEYEYTGSFHVYEVYFNKRGAQISAGRNAETDQVELYLASTFTDSSINYAFVLTFEKDYE